MKKRKALTPREKILKKKRDKLLNNLNKRQRRLKKKSDMLLDKRAAIMKKRPIGKRAKKNIRDRVEHIKRRRS